MAPTTWKPRTLRPQHPPEACWFRLEEILGCSHEHAERLRQRWRIGELVDDGGARGYEVVWGWSSAAAVSGMTEKALRRAVRRGHLPLAEIPGGRRGPGGAQVAIALSVLLRYARWCAGECVR